MKDPCSLVWRVVLGGLVGLGLASCGGGGGGAALSDEIVYRLEIEGRSDVILKDDSTYPMTLRISSRRPLGNRIVLFESDPRYVEPISQVSPDPAARVWETTIPIRTKPVPRDVTSSIQIKPSLDARGATIENLFFTLRAD